VLDVPAVTLAPSYRFEQQSLPPASDFGQQCLPAVSESGQQYLPVVSDSAPCPSLGKEGGQEERTGELLGVPTCLQLGIEAWV
jgi:hypothetical protein